MFGTFLNVATILIGGALGTLFGLHLPVRFREIVLHAIGLTVIVLGFKMSTESLNILIVFASLLLGGLLGEWWNFELRLERLGVWLDSYTKRFSRGDSQAAGSERFVRGFTTASLVFCVGPMAILGSIQDGLSGDLTLLAAKSAMDGFAAMVFAASFGIGVVLSAVPVFLYQGGLTLLAVEAEALFTPGMMAELTATGGVLIMALGISRMLEIVQIRVANYLPALVFAPAIVALLDLFGWGLS